MKDQNQAKTEEVEELAKQMSGKAQSRHRKQLQQRPEVRGYLVCSKNSKEGSDRGGQRRRPVQVWPCADIFRTLTFTVKEMGSFCRRMMLSDFHPKRWFCEMHTKNKMN